MERKAVRRRIIIILSVFNVMKGVIISTSVLKWKNFLNKLKKVFGKGIVIIKVNDDDVEVFLRV